MDIESNRPPLPTDHRRANANLDKIPVYESSQ
jgi:hypothetical protein